MNKTSIPYADLSWNIVTGCTPAGEGCLNCWAAKLAATRLARLPRYKGLAQACPRGYEWTGEVRFHADLLDQPRRLRATPPRRIFVAPMGDLFHPRIADFDARAVFGVLYCEACVHHVFLLLTKRPATMASLFILGDGTAVPVRGHIWPGFSAWNQESFDTGWRSVSKIDSGLRWVSLEPLLGPVNLSSALISYAPSLAWVVVGGESGPNARPCDPDWILSIWRQCQAARIPFYFKQWGNNTRVGDFSRDDNALVEVSNTREIPCSK